MAKAYSCNSVHTSGLRARLQKALERAIPVLSRAGKKTLMIWKGRSIGSRICLAISLMGM